MAFESRDPGGASGRGGFPPLTTGERTEIDDQLVRVIEQTHDITLTEVERAELRASLAAQQAAIAVLRRFELANHDAPCFAVHLARDIDGGR